MSRADDLAWFQGFADEARWRFAKTYVESYPHEYTLRRWCEADDFWKAIRCVERWGVVESFWGTERKYLYDGDRKYWHMGDAESEDPAKRPGLINRTWLDVSRYREEARALGYDGPEPGRADGAMASSAGPFKRRRGAGAVGTGSVGVAGCAASGNVP